MRRFICSGVCFWIALLFSADLYAEEYVPIGPSETVPFEKGLFHCTGGGVKGVWPSTATLTNAVPTDRLPAAYVQELKAWLDLVLRPQFKPVDTNAVEWKGLRNLHWNYNFIIGRWETAQQEATVEVQADEQGMGVSVVSAKLLNMKASEITDGDLRKLASLVLAIPEEKLDKIEIEKRVREVAGAPVCFGHMRCEWHERSGGVAPHWWSGIGFWFINGKLFLGIGMVKPDPNRATAKRGTERWKF